MFWTTCVHLGFWPNVRSRLLDILYSFFWIPTRQSCKTVILSFSYITDDFPCLNKVFTLHYIRLHCIALHYITLHYITLHYIALHCIALHCITLHYITLHYITLHYITLHYITLHYITLHGCLDQDGVKVHKHIKTDNTNISAWLIDYLLLDIKGAILLRETSSNPEREKARNILPAQVANHRHDLVHPTR